jgi:hypothetical protein
VGADVRVHEVSHRARAAHPGDPLSASTDRADPLQLGHDPTDVVGRLGDLLRHLLAAEHDLAGVAAQVLEQQRPKLHGLLRPAGMLMQPADDGTVLGRRQHDEGPPVLGNGLAVDGGDDGTGRLLRQPRKIQDHLAQRLGLFPSQPLGLRPQPMQGCRHVDSLRLGLVLRDH